MKQFITAIVVLSLCVVPAIVFADGWENFKGTYEMTSSGSCIHSEKGFSVGSDGWYTADPKGTVYAGTTVGAATWTFEPDGTGTYQGIMYATVTPPSIGTVNPTGSVPGGLRIFPDTNPVPFTYSINTYGDIIVTEKNPPKIEYTGTVSPDWKNIILLDTPKVKPLSGQPLPKPYWFILCTASRILIQVNQ